MTEPAPNARILVFENDAIAADAIRAALATPSSGSFEVECVGQLSVGLERLAKTEIDAILLELALPDSHGIDTFEKVCAAAPNIPVLILCGNGDEVLAKQAVGRGAQDYLLPHHVDSYSLPRALRNAIERQGFEDELYSERERAVVTLNSIGDAVLCTNVSGNITYLNLVAETMTGWSRAEAIGKPLTQVFRIVDSATGKAPPDPMAKAVEQNKAVRLPGNSILVRRDGSESAIEDSAAPIPRSGWSYHRSSHCLPRCVRGAGHVASNEPFRAARCGHKSTQSFVG